MMDERAQATRPFRGPAAQPPQAAGRTVMPRTDIIETPNEIYLIADMPGVDEKGIDLTVERNVLTLSGRAGLGQPADSRLEFAEYRAKEYQRVFVLPEEVDQATIRATLKNGVLQLVLPKAKAQRSRKIQVATD